MKNSAFYTIITPAKKSNFGPEVLPEVSNLLPKLAVGQMFVVPKTDVKHYESNKNGYRGASTTNLYAKVNNVRRSRKLKGHYVVRENGVGYEVLRTA